MITQINRNGNVMKFRITKGITPLHQFHFQCMVDTKIRIREEQISSNVSVTFNNILVRKLKN